MNVGGKRKEHHWQDSIKRLKKINIKFLICHLVIMINAPCCTSMIVATRRGMNSNFLPTTHMMMFGREQATCRLRQSFQYGLRRPLHYHYKRNLSSTQLSLRRQQQQSYQPHPTLHPRNSPYITRRAMNGEIRESKEGEEPKVDEIAQFDSVPDMAGWTIDKVIEGSIRLLNQQNVEEADSSVYHILSSSLDLSWETGYRELQQEYLQMQRERRRGGGRTSLSSSMLSSQLTTEQAIDFLSKLNRRIEHEPIQYILGKWDFLDYTIKISPPLLCPRPETEELVCKIIEETTESPVHILDVGCGTGVIGIALADQLMDAFVHAIDIDPVAIQVSNDNAKTILGQYYDQDACYSTQLISAEDYRTPDHTYDIIVSNPPYIPETDRHTISDSVLQYENHKALFSGNDGLDCIRSIIQQLKTSSWGHTDSVCWMEVDPSQPIKIKKYVEDNPKLGVAFEDYYKDMFGNDRFVKLRVL